MFDFFKVSIIISALFFSCTNNQKDKSISFETPNGMVWVEGKSYTKGAKQNDHYAMMREKPSHEVYIDGFYIDVTEVTNNQFQKFINETGYLTIAEREIDWDEMKKSLPAGTPKPHDSILQPGSLIFNDKLKKVDNMNNYFQWWRWQTGANWRSPKGPGSNIENKGNYPVVHIAYEDAKAYCEWANRRLPTEAEWESAAQGNYKNAVFPWGDETNLLDSNANTWQGNFPVKNESIDGYEMIAPVKSFPANSIGIFDMVGNVWEITGDLFNVNYYSEISTETELKNLKGASSCYNPSNPYEIQYVMKGGSFLCHDSYCASYRISARMGVSVSSGSDHTGFRTVATTEMLLNK
ncbi:formylglycine-generating enzyme family protein [Bacteroidota bacterium]|nr:formylglycine-generating enzyme family protein [Bacteroidota bacterium]